MAIDTIVLPYDGSEAADAMLRLACQVVDRPGRLIALYTTRVPASLPLDPLPAWFDDEGNEKLDRAEALAAARDVAIETTLTRVRRPVDAIVAEARRCEAAAIFLARPSWRRPWRRLGAAITARAVRRRAPCPVLVGSWFGPADYAGWNDAAAEPCAHSGRRSEHAHLSPIDGRASDRVSVIRVRNARDEEKKGPQGQTNHGPIVLRRPGQ
jgi:nucleotide-binding universal stress UspA family protein